MARNITLILASRTIPTRRLMTIVLNFKNFAPSATIYISPWNLCSSLTIREKLARYVGTNCGRTRRTIEIRNIIICRGGGRGRGEARRWILKHRATRSDCKSRVLLRPRSNLVLADRKRLLLSSSAERGGAFLPVGQ